MTVLVINSGSSSIKYQLVNPETGQSIASGLVEKIGEAEGHIEHNYNGTTTDINEPVPDHGVGLREVIRFFNEVGPNLSEAGIKAVGHRVVQGGKHFDKAAVIDDRVEGLIEELIPLGPLHNPAHLKGIKVARELFDVPNVAVFDTAFFQHLPAEAATYAIDREVAEKYQVRRYGAHGTSHQFISRKVSDMLGRDDLKQIVMHLGNGASVSAVVNGQAVDTSMGLTPLEGLVMGTRTGDIDPAAAFHLARQANMSIDELDTLFNKQSGLKGLTGSNDMRTVWEMADAGDPQAIEALEIYTHRLLKYVGSYTAVMGGLDVLTFTAGVGENSWQTRKMLLDRLAPFGVKYDAEKNMERSKEPREVSTPDSAVKVLVIPTNEELSIAQQAMDVI
ncbi:acetate/propionate family kinase [Arcanobacterium pinnipediorum]|uniref:Acetate kinase n=1 Tax=Arcanobacterium pinnipediorum TaxID=1503041 RepID=A0ABY5AFS7_9ACTO|nr:acetate kinase [Arcanobacterium pinnipediorum]USR79040.1 acetate kinase [Arcanobacterium pinnipediorum]